MNASNQNVATSYLDTIDKLILLLLLSVMLADTANGFLLRSGINLPLSISQAFKIVMMGLMAISVALRSQRDLAWLAIAVAFFTLSLLLHTQHALSFSAKSNMIMTFKALVLFFSFFYFKNLVQGFANGIPKAYKLMIHLNLAVILLNIIIGVAGFGYAQYKGNIGGIGFLYGGNEISSILVILAGISLYFIWSKSKTGFYVFAAVLLGCAIFKATKVSLLGILLMVIFVPFISRPDKLKELISFRSLHLLAAPAIVLVMTFIGVYAFEAMGLTDRWEYFLRKYNYKLLSVLFSGRDFHFIYCMDMLRMDYNFIDLLFGKGHSSFMVDYEFYLGRSNTVEMDFMDVWSTNGLLGLLVIYSLYVFVVFRSISGFLSSGEHVYLLVAVLTGIIFLTSMLTGHVAYSASNNLFLGLLFSLIYLQNSGKPFENTADKQYVPV